MNYKQHIGYYIILTIIILFFLNYYDHIQITQYIIIGFLIGIIYTLLPDLDIPTSKIRKYTSIIGLLVIIGISLYSTYVKTTEYLYLIVLTALFLGFLWFTKHRGLLHSPVMGIIFILPLVYLSHIYVIFALWGYTLHLILDRL